MSSVHPVIQDSKSAAAVILALQKEMNRRYQEKDENSPFLVCVVDEATTLISNFGDKKTQDAVCDALSDLLRRGRKVRIIWVLATQNPTKASLKIELANVTTRVSFQCARSQNSITILGEAGAENLEGNGDMLFKGRSISKTMRLQGAYPEPEDIEEIVSNLSQIQCDFPNKFTIFDSNFHHDDTDAEDQQQSGQESEKDKERNQELCRIILWTLGQKQISSIKIMEEFNMGNRANDVLQKMTEFGIISELVGKKSRDALCQKLEDLSEDAILFLTENGVLLTEIKEVFCKNLSQRR